MTFAFSKVAFLCEKQYFTVVVDGQDVEDSWSSGEERDGQDGYMTPDGTFHLISKSPRDQEGPRGWMSPLSEQIEERSGIRMKATFKEGARERHKERPKRHDKHEESQGEVR